jgi:hypothetical protein
MKHCQAESWHKMSVLTGKSYFAYLHLFKNEFYKYHILLCEPNSISKIDIAKNNIA